VFGIRPVELQGLEVREEGGVPVATVTRGKTNSHGTTAMREVVAVPPSGWPADCFDLVERLHEHGIAPHLTDRRNVGDRMAHQLKRLQLNRQVKLPLHGELTPYSLRHAYALRLGIDLGLSIREASDMMGHSPAVHVSTYGRRLDTPKLNAKVQQLVRQKVLETNA
jgi:integrase